MSGFPNHKTLREGDELSLDCISEVRKGFDPTLMDRVPSTLMDSIRPTLKVRVRAHPNGKGSTPP